MPAIPVYSASPINAAKASGTTPQTAAPEQNDSSRHETPAQTTNASTSANAGSGASSGLGLGSGSSYPAPQPAAAPSLAAPTATATATAQPQPSAAAVLPTPTQDNEPPAPQPGAVPVPPSSKASHLPPPPKAGEAQNHPEITAAPAPPTTMQMPPQMSYAPPAASYMGGGGTSTSTTATGPPPSTLGQPGPTSIREAAGGQPGGVGGDSYSHPPGYHQDVNASEFSSAQRTAHDVSVANQSYIPGAGDDESVWDTAKKWANAAGSSLAAAENEVWKRINKD